ncbi:AraC family transcriptional regulator N-terminal domain-containing protein [Streptomyces pratisoli]|uniref:AraC family transcriptional regulator N-terminal domain-containing protein n=1 Tax=Streptomyces pratisoli TaxID=3139917 RepID=UPI003C12C51C
MAKIKGECKQPSSQAVHVSQVDDNTLSAFLHFFRSLSAEMDRRVLAPIHLQEIIYRLNYSSRAGGMHAPCSMVERDGQPISEAIQYIRERISEPLTVPDIANRAGMSPSTLTISLVKQRGWGPISL